MPSFPESPPYAELHALSSFSFQRGASQPSELVERAHALGLRADASYEAIIEQYIEDCKSRPGYPAEALNGLK